MGDWIKLYRGAIDSRAFSDECAWRLLTWLMLSVNWKAGYHQGERVEPGQKVTSWPSMASALGWSESKVRRVMAKLEKYECVTRKATGKWQVVELVNYRSMQGSDSVGRQDDEQGGDQPGGREVNRQPTGERQGSEQATDTNRRREERKKGRREESKKENAADEIRNSDEWQAWRRHRIERQRPLGATEEDMQLYELTRHDVAEALEMVRFTIGKGAMNLITNGDHRSEANAPQASNGRKSTAMALAATDI